MDDGTGLYLEQFCFTVSFVVKMMMSKGINENKFDISQVLIQIEKCVFIYVWVHTEAISKRALLCCAHVFLCVLFLQVYASERGLRGKADVIGQMPSSSQSCVCVCTQTEQWDRQRLPPPAAQLGAPAE